VYVSKNYNLFNSAKHAILCSLYFLHTVYKKLRVT